MLNNRTGFIGGSDIAALLGISKWKSPYLLYLEKIGCPQPISQEQEDFFQRRKMAEPYVLSYFSHKTGINPTAINERYVHSKYDFMSCEIDFEFFDEKISKTVNGEIKCLSYHNDMSEWGDDFTNDVPYDYLCQSMFGLGVTGREYCRYAVMRGFDEFNEYIVYRDDDLIEMLNEKAIEFWKRIQDRNPPPPKTISDFKIRMPNGKSICGNKDIFEKVTRLKELKQQAKEIEDLEDEIKIFIGDNNKLISESSILATWNEQEKTSINTSDLKELYPRIYDSLKKITKFRVLRIK